MTIYPFKVSSEIDSLKVTLVWDDEPADQLSSPTLVNDLDLKLVSPSGITYYPLIPNPSNPNDLSQSMEDHTNLIEQIKVENPETGEWKASVYAFALPIPNQSYSIVSDQFGTTNTKALIVYNEGKVPLFVENIHSNRTWLSVDKTYLSISSLQSGTIQVKVNSNGLYQGTYEGSVIMNTNDQEHPEFTVPVSLVIRGSGETPVLSVKPDTLDFLIDKDILTFSICNSGGGDLDWFVENTIPWLSLTQTKGITSASQYSIITAQINRRQMLPGHYEERIYISSNGGSDVLTISADMANNSILVAEPSSLEFESSELEKSIVIYNKGTGIINWEATTSDTWLTVFPNSGDVFTEIDVPLVNVDRTGLSSGVYSSALTIRNTLNNEIVTIPVVLYVVWSGVYWVFW
jgi:hypothetical protein